ncbi:N-acetyltransferase [Streptomyces sp. WAC05374]|uniref:GNAT family N-acetyltransferase n=1 Tax=Streptomyces sp. WAC05374 TaxID=2487420 RepID=UPI000F85C03D|nr:GNAT family N-acetyltransferase [Streptomyces sp. WAC05374]RST14396.1 N-acetyltransferase [Streptomyces sp. WAC05374]TDF44713.1 N-acetyltransferase [Streptomyces sp. WAC05374]TDF55953.1 N-acetyltransferase [Streptomyces sp. WAC05374]TDF59874.1 N-acetyltransferase [Streptomyces sp. WAC05374]
MTITVGGEDKELSERLDKELTAFNRAATGASDEAELSVRATDDAGGITGGLTGWTWGGLGGISMLWVREDQRGTGLGTRLMRAAEEEARRRGCDRMIVSSFSFQAPDFYRRLGYVETGCSEGIPGGNVDVHFFKSLDPSAGPLFRLAVLLDFPADAAADALAYEERVLSLLPRHGGRLERRLRTADGLSEVHLLTFPSEDAYRAYLADPGRTPDGRITARVLEVTEVHG